MSSMSTYHFSKYVAETRDSFVLQFPVDVAMQKDILEERVQPTKLEEKSGRTLSSSGWQIPLCSRRWRSSCLRSGRLLRIQRPTRNNTSSYGSRSRWIRLSFGVKTKLRKCRKLSHKNACPPMWSLQKVDVLVNRIQDRLGEPVRVTPQECVGTGLSDRDCRHTSSSGYLAA